MADKKLHNSKHYKIRAKLPFIFRAAAVAAIFIAIIVVVVGLFRERSRAAFTLKSEHAKLSTDVVSEVNGYERLETDDGIPRYLIKADHAKTFADQHLELSNVYLELYDQTGALSDRLSGSQALYIPEKDKNFTTYLKGNVRIETSDALRITAEEISYSRGTEIAESGSKVEFERDNVRGTSFGATARLADKKLELHRDVEIETFESEELLRSNIRYARMTAGNASFDQVSNRITLTSAMAINIVQAGTTSDISAQRAHVDLSGADARSKDVRQLEFFDQVKIISKGPSGSPTTIDSGYALFVKDGQRYELKNAVHIVTSANGGETDIRSADAIYEAGSGKLAMTGGVVILNGADEVKGDTAHANLFSDQKLKDAVVRGSAFLRQVSPTRSFTINAPELNASWADSRELRDVNAIGQSSLEMIPVNDDSVSKVLANAAGGIGMVFKGKGSIDAVRTDGRTSIDLRARPGVPNATNKRVVADSIKTQFQANGKDFKRAEAVGNAELTIDPLIADAKNYKTTINAPRFDCAFLATGNTVEVCTAERKAKAIRQPTVQGAKKGNQSINADTLVARFDPASGDIAVLEANGNAKYTELDRNAIARQMTFTYSDEIIRLRGGDPNVWDSRGRAKAVEIDVDTRNNRSSLRNNVTTTYYNQKNINRSTPFANDDKPVYLTANAAVFDHDAETAVYSGNARGWQDSNYVRGDRISIDEIKGTFVAEGKVQSMIHNARIGSKGKQTIVPTSASAGSLEFDRRQRLLRYRNSVDIRQGTDRITAGSADIYLDERNEMVRTVAETNVAISQSTRRASGDWIEYRPSDEVAILRGSPASISDQETGSSQSAQITMSLRDNRISSEAKTKQNPSGRIRSVYRIKDLKP